MKQDVPEKLLTAKDAKALHEQSRDKDTEQAQSLLTEVLRRIKIEAKGIDGRNGNTFLREPLAGIRTPINANTKTIVYSKLQELGFKVEDVQCGHDKSELVVSWKDA